MSKMLTALLIGAGAVLFFKSKNASASPSPIPIDPGLPVDPEPVPTPEPLPEPPYTLPYVFEYARVTKLQREVISGWLQERVYYEWKIRPNGTIYPPVDFIEAQIWVNGALLQGNAWYAGYQGSKSPGCGRAFEFWAEGIYPWEIQIKAWSLDEVGAKTVLHASAVTTGQVQFNANGLEWYGPSDTGRR